MKTQMVDRCDGCGRFVSPLAPMDVSFSHYMDMGGNVTEEETRLCSDCSAAFRGEA